MTSSPEFGTLRRVDYQDLIAEYNGLTAAAEALGYSKQTVFNWKSAGIPEDQQLFIAKKNPRLKADPAIVKKYRGLLAA